MEENSRRAIRAVSENGKRIFLLQEVIFYLKQICRINRIPCNNFYLIVYLMIIEGNIIEKRI